MPRRFQRLIQQSDDDDDDTDESNAHNPHKMHHHADPPAGKGSSDSETEDDLRLNEAGSQSDSPSSKTQRQTMEARPHNRGRTESEEVELLPLSAQNHGDDDGVHNLNAESDQAPLNGSAESPGQNRQGRMHNWAHNLTDCLGFVSDRQPGHWKKRPWLVLLLAGILPNFTAWFSFGLAFYLKSFMEVAIFPPGDEYSPEFKALRLIWGPYFLTFPGGLIFGYTADRFGRKPTLVVCLLLLCLGTLAIVAIPEVENSSTLPMTLLTMMRFLQGFAMGGMGPASIVLTLESCFARRRGFFGGLCAFGSTFGLMMAKVTAASLSNRLTDEEMLAWGWRIPFVIGGINALVALLIFFMVLETPVYRAQIPIRFPGLEALIDFPIEVGLVAGVFALWFSGVPFIADWIPVYLSDFTSQPISHLFGVEISAEAIFCVSLPLCGYLSDWKGRVDIMFLGSLLLWVAVIPLFFLYTAGKIALVFVASICLFMMLSLTGAPAAAWASESFPPRLRCSGIGMGMNFSLAIFGGTAPSMASALLLQTHWDSSPSFFLTAMAVGAGVSLIFTKRLSPVPKFVDPDPF